MPERLTRKNGSGELANRLGQYEDLGTVKELTELKNRIKK